MEDSNGQGRHFGLPILDFGLEGGGGGAREESAICGIYGWNAGNIDVGQAFQPDATCEPTCETEPKARAKDSPRSSMDERRGPNRLAWGPVSPQHAGPRQAGKPDLLRASEQ